MDTLKESILASRIIGVGSGRTVRHFVDAYMLPWLLHHQHQEKEHAERVFVPTSDDTRMFLIERKVPVGDLRQYPTIDIVIDGFDCLVGDHVAIKGGGGCMLWEKLVFVASKQRVLVGFPDKFGVSKSTVPLEVVPMAATFILSNIEGSRLRCSATGKLGPIVTDLGNWIVDVDIGGADGATLIALHARWKAMAGVIDTGIFQGPFTALKLPSST